MQRLAAATVEVAPMYQPLLQFIGSNPSAGRVRWSTVYIAGVYTLIVSRHYETVHAHSKHELIGGLQHGSLTWYQRTLMW